MAGRTVSKHTRVYVGGVDLSGNTRGIGPLTMAFDEAEVTAFADPVKGYLPNLPQVGVGTLNAIFDTNTTASHALLQAPAQRNVTVAIGDRAAPAVGDVAFCAVVNQSAYFADVSSGALFTTIPFENFSVTSSLTSYAQAYGILLNPNTARTGANAGTGTDNPTGGSTAFGGWLMYHVLAGNGTATISVDDSADNSSFAALSGATSGSINCAVVTSGLVALGRTATVRRYLRWQLALGTATSVTFVLAFMRAFHSGH